MCVNWDRKLIFELQVAFNTSIADWLDPTKQWPTGRQLSSHKPSTSLTWHAPLQQLKLILLILKRINLLIIELNWLYYLKNYNFAVSGFNRTKCIIKITVLFLYNQTCRSGCMTSRSHLLASIPLCKKNVYVVYNTKLYLLGFHTCQHFSNFHVTVKSRRFCRICFISGSFIIVWSISTSSVNIFEWIKWSGYMVYLMLTLNYTDM